MREAIGTLRVRLLWSSQLCCTGKNHFFGLLYTILSPAVSNPLCCLRLLKYCCVCPSVLSSDVLKAFYVSVHYHDLTTPFLYHVAPASVQGWHCDGQQHAEQRNEEGHGGLVHMSAASPTGVPKQESSCTSRTLQAEQEPFKSAGHSAGGQGSELGKGTTGHSRTGLRFSLLCMPL
jgi:hypothetical protein